MFHTTISLCQWVSTYALNSCPIPEFSCSGFFKNGPNWNAPRLWVVGTLTFNNWRRYSFKVSCPYTLASGYAWAKISYPEVWSGWKWVNMIASIGLSLIIFCRFWRTSSAASWDSRVSIRTQELAPSIKMQLAKPYPGRKDIVFSFKLDNDYKI